MSGEAKLALFLIVASRTHLLFCAPLFLCSAWAESGAQICIDMSNQRSKVSKKELERSTVIKPSLEVITVA